MNLKCMTSGHDYEMVGTRWIENMQDMYIATNYGGVLASYEYQIYRCKRCLKEKLIYTGNKKYD